MILNINLEYKLTFSKCSYILNIYYTKFRLYEYCGQVLKMKSRITSLSFDSSDSHYK